MGIVTQSAANIAIKVTKAIEGVKKVDTTLLTVQ
jgi:osmotically-inducible protein OsmY